MTLVSVTAVAAFDAVGSVLEVALMIVPPAAAYLLTDRLSRMLLWSVALGVAGALGGYWLAHWLNSSLAGSMASVTGLAFGLVYLFAPNRGLVALARRRRRQRWDFARRMLVIHLLHHEGQPDAERECRVDHLQDHLRWPPAFAERVVRQARRLELVVPRDGLLALTPAGRDLAREAFLN
jgi:manganese/zinc/iron transport system permease protein